MKKTSHLEKKIQFKATSWDGDVLLVKLTAPPEKGKANAALVSLLAEKLKIG